MKPYCKVLAIKIKMK